MKIILQNVPPHPKVRVPLFDQLESSLIAADEAEIRKQEIVLLRDYFSDSNFLTFYY